MPNILRDSKTGLHFRPDSYDLNVAKEVSSYRMLMPSKGGTLLDVGGNIGCVSRWWLRSGGERAVAVEPEPENLVLLRKNLNEFGDRAVVIPSAAVAVGSPSTISFYLNSGINKGSHTTRPTRGRKEIKVSTIPFAELLTAYQPDALKVDIEGAEYQLQYEILNLPSCVTRFAIEWHLNAPKNARETAYQMDRQLKQSGWKCVHGMGSKIMGKNWHITRSYLR
jgi:FkbM family methyltransferase